MALLQYGFAGPHSHLWDSLLKMLWLMRRLWPMMLLVATMGTVGSQNLAVAQIESLVDSISEVDFGAHVWPIFQSRCFVCHGAEKQEGSLRLDSKTAIDQGGHTGNRIIGDTLEESELYRRITSSDPSYRMPRMGPPLMEQQISLVKRWIEQGALWSKDFDRSNERSRPLDFWTRCEKYLGPLEKIYEHVHVIFYPCLGFLFVVLLIERGKLLHARRHRWTIGRMAPLFRGVSRIGPSDYLVIILAFGTIGLWLYHRGTIIEALEESKELQNRLTILTQSEGVQEMEGGDSGGPVPLRPKHPPRLGGSYYRGNDERSPQLFNGGYYRTATFHVTLCDGDKKKVAWGDNVAGSELLVCVEMEKAPNATPALFTDKIIDSTLLSRQVAGKEIPELVDIPVRFEAVEDGQRWRAYYPIGAVKGDGDKEQTFSGLIYLYSGSLSQNSVSGSIHYGIAYDVTLNHGRVHKRSEVWMGSLYNIGNLFVPPAGSISLHEWFDFLPIPEITGTNTDDPKLLGINQHIPDNAGASQ